MQIIIYENGEDHIYDCANGFVSRVVSAVHAENFADARRIAQILNAYFRAEDVTAMAKQREECARIADDLQGEGPEMAWDNGGTRDGWDMACTEIAARIRKHQSQQHLWLCGSTESAA